VAEDYISRHVSKLKSKRSTTLVIKRELLGLHLRRHKIDGKWLDEWLPGAEVRWREKQAGKLTRRDAVELLEKIAESSPSSPQSFATMSNFFKWAILRDAYCIENNPVSNITHTDIPGSFTSRHASSRTASCVKFGTLPKLRLILLDRLSRC